MDVILNTLKRPETFIYECAGGVVLIKTIPDGRLEMFQWIVNKQLTILYSELEI